MRETATSTSVQKWASLECAKWDLSSKCSKYLLYSLIQTVTKVGRRISRYIQLCLIKRHSIAKRCTCKTQCGQGKMQFTRSKRSVLQRSGKREERLKKILEKRLEKGGNTALSNNSSASQGELNRRQSPKLLGEGLHLPNLANRALAIDLKNSRHKRYTWRIKPYYMWYAERKREGEV